MMYKKLSSTPNYPLMDEEVLAFWSENKIKQKLLELNNKKEETSMNEAEIKALVEQTVSTYKNAEVEINQCKEDCAKQIAEANSATEAVIVEKNELQASVDELNAAKTVAGVRYFNLAGQEMQEANGMTIVVTTYTDGTTTAVKVMK